MKPSHMKELQKELSGQVTNVPSVLAHYATDGSIFKVQPSAVVYPRGTDDVRSAVAYVAALRQKGKNASIIARGNGTDQSGGALGDGVMMVFPAHMNKLVRLTKDTVTVQAGINYGALQKVLSSHGRFLPPYPASMEFSSIGGAIANNASGEKSFKYGATRDFVSRLKVVLADGSIVETKRLSRRELNQKKGQMTLEGEIYRKIDSLIIDHAGLIQQSMPRTSKNSSGYALDKVKRKDGSFDLGQLMVGAQGTLGIVTEATLRTELSPPRTSLIVGYFDSVEKAGEAILRLRKLGPSAMEMVDRSLIEVVRKNRPHAVDGLIPDETPQVVVLIEFDHKSGFRQNMLLRRAAAILKQTATGQRNSISPKEQDALWQIRRSAAAVMWMHAGKTKALPIIEDACVPVEKLPEFIKSAYKLLGKHKLELAMWGHAGDGNFHMQPLLDLSKAKDRRVALDVIDEFYTMVIKMGGTTSGAHNDGLLRAPYLEKLYGNDMYDLFVQVKHICDPLGVLNPRIKLGVSLQDIEPLIRHEYSMAHLYDHMPHT